MSVNKRISAVMLAACFVGFTAFAQPAKAGIDAADETMTISEAAGDDYEEVAEVSASPASDFVYEVAGDYSSVLIIRYKGKDTNVVVPSEIEGIPVTELGSNAFINNKKVESVVIPDSVVSLMGRNHTGNDGVFKGCSSLKYVVIPETIDVLPEGCFYGCSSLEDVVLPSGIKEIPAFAFYKCSSLTSIVIPDGVNYIGRNAFGQCRALEDFLVPESTAKIRFGNYLVFDNTKFALSKKQEIYKLGYKGSF